MSLLYSTFEGPAKIQGENEQGHLLQQPTYEKKFRSCRSSSSMHMILHCQESAEFLIVEE